MIQAAALDLQAFLDATHEQRQHFATAPETAALAPEFSQWALVNVPPPQMIESLQFYQGYLSAIATLFYLFQANEQRWSSQSAIALAVQTMACWQQLEQRVPPLADVVEGLPAWIGALSSEGDIKKRFGEVTAVDLVQGLLWIQVEEEKPKPRKAADRGKLWDLYA